MTSRVPRSIGAALLSLVVAAGCSSAEWNAATTDGTARSGGAAPAGAATVDYSTLSGTLNGAGSTFQGKFNEEVIASIQEVAPNLQVNYPGGGSGAGKNQLAAQSVDFAGTDSLIKDDEKAGFKGGATLYVPTVAAPVVVAVNVGGVEKLQLSPETIAGIFQGDIARWDAEAIKADNPGVALPGGDIRVVRRADGSGTTETFTKYLKEAVPSFAIAAGSSPTWPAQFTAANGNGGVAKAVKDTDGAIGYVDFSDAKTAGLRMAAVKNKSGAFVAPSLEATTAALDEVTIKPDATYTALNSEGAAAYPIVASTYIIVYQQQTDAAKGNAVKGLLTYILNEGQELADDVDYAKLSSSLRAKALEQVGKIQVP